MAERRLEPWEADPKWHPARREAFEHYRDQGPGRSQAATAKALGKSRQIVGKWSHENGWVERCAAWDAECDRVRREEFMEATGDVAAEQAEAAASFRLALLEPASAVLARIEALKGDGKDPFEGVDLPELIRLTATSGRALAQVVHVERLARGMSTDNRAGHDGGPLSPGEAEVAAKSTDQIEAYLTGRRDEREAREGATDRRGRS